MEGDPALRARRRRIARAWRSDPGEALAGASLVLTSADGLTVVLSGGPPPRRVAVRSVARGAPGLRLGAAAGTARVPLLAAPELARRLAERLGPALPPAGRDLAELAALWPSAARPAPRRETLT